MTLNEAAATIDRLVADLARATGRPENLIRLSYGLELETDPDDRRAGSGLMPRFIATLRTPAAIAGTVAGPYVQQMLQHPDDGQILDQETAREEGAVRIAFEADDQADADLHASLLAQRAPGVEVQRVTEC